MLPRFLVLFALLSLVLRTGPVCADLVFVSVTREVEAVVGDNGGLSTSSAPGIFIASVDITGDPPRQMFTASAMQNSTTPNLTGMSMDGTGSGSVSDPNTGLGGSALAESFFDVFFEVDLPGLYSLSADVGWMGDSPFIGFSQVQLDNITTSTTLATIFNSNSSQGASNLTQVFALIPLNTYRLVAEVAIARSDVFNSGILLAAGDWSFELTAIPEARGWLMLGVVAVGAAAARTVRARWVRAA